MTPLTLHFRRPEWLVGLLILTLLGPGLVPVQGHTHFERSRDGGLQTVCTWDKQAQQDIPEPWQSPAYLYAQLLGGAAFGDLGILVSAEKLPEHFLVEPFLRREDQAAPRRYLIRAPPAVLA